MQDAKLFDWLTYLYEIWKGVDEDAVYWSSRLAMAELLKTGCTLTTDHHYLYPRGFKDDLPGIQFAAATELGIRFAPTRGSMSLSKKDGGLPPDSVVQDEDRILAECESTISEVPRPGPRLHAEGLPRSLLALLRLGEVDARDRGAREAGTACGCTPTSRRPPTRTNTASPTTAAGRSG